MFACSNLNHIAVAILLLPPQSFILKQRTVVFSGVKCLLDLFCPFLLSFYSFVSLVIDYKVTCIIKNKEVLTTGIETNLQFSLQPLGSLKEKKHFFFKLNNYFISKTKKPVTKQANSKKLISYTVSYTKVYKLRNSR